MSERRLIISGTREALSAEDRARVIGLLDEHAHGHVTIGVGDCSTGIDALVRQYDPTARVFVADWDGDGKHAGPARNGRLVAWCAKAGGVLLAFPGPKSRGTWDCVRKAQSAGLALVVRKVGR